MNPIPRPMSLTDIARRVAVATKRPNVVQLSEARAHRVMRELVARKAIQPTGYSGTGRTAAALFDEAAACRLLIATELDRLGLPLQTLQLASCCMNNREGPDGIAPAPKPKRLRDDRLVPIIARLRDGQVWWFHLFLMPEYFGTPGSVLGGCFSRNPGVVGNDFAHRISLQLLPILGPLTQRGE